MDEVVKQGYFVVLELASGEKADVLISGHTHVPQLGEFTIDGKHVQWGNPGSWVDEEEEEEFNTAIYIDENGPWLLQCVWDKTGTKLETWIMDTYQPRSSQFSEYSKTAEFREKLTKRKKRLEPIT
jgi:hypothetical protein